MRLYQPLSSALLALLHLLPLLLLGCASPTASIHAPEEALSGAWAEASGFPQAGALGPWEHYVLPAKQATLFSSQRLDGRAALKANAQSSASMLRRKLRIEPEALGSLRFSWLVESLIAQSDMGDRDTDDSPVRIVLAFDGDRSQFSQRNAMLSELALMLTGEPMPYATLMYSWCKTRESGQTIVNPRTDRIRTLIVESGSQGLGRWKDYVRDVRADYQAAFGEAPGALVAIGVMTDADNTRSQAVAWYGPLQLEPPRSP
ncbi:MAG: hypothetical protein CFE43_20120 [Burkholderiales bacterium PBB3]|nr:MAG: hypothetical protein CFE43_20120 [Burkholderiales bacterium PBB3]